MSDASPAAPADHPRPADRLPAVEAERCVHSHLEQASCRACVAACPSDAWVLDEERLGLDTTRCDGCGRCVPACPQEALQLPVETVQIRLDGGRRHLAGLACERAAPDARGPGVVPCVHAFGLRPLATLATQGLDGLLVSTGECAACPRRGGEGSTLAQALGHLNDILAVRGIKPLRAITLRYANWRDLRDRDVPRDRLASSGRRAFLREGLARLVESATPSAADTTPQATAPRPASAILGGLGQGIAEWRPLLDVTRCSACDSCVRVCPTDALRLEAEPHPAYRITPDACTGCRLCSDVCEADAITIGAFGSAEVRTIALRAQRCRACGVGFHAIAETDAEPDALCHVCRRVNHAARLFQVLD